MKGPEQTVMVTYTVRPANKKMNLGLGITSDGLQLQAALRPIQPKSAH